MQTMAKLGLKEILYKADLLPRAVDSVIIVDMSSDLKLFNLELKDGTKLSALKTFKLGQEEADKFIINSLKDFIHQNNIQHKNFILIPPLDLVVFKRIQLPLMPQAELFDAIKWQIKDGLTFDLSQAIVDYLILKEIDKEDGTKTLDCLVMAAKELEIKEKISLLKQLGLGCVSVIPFPLCYTELVSRYFLKGESDAIGVLHLGEAVSFINIYKNKKLEFYREAPLPADKLREALKTALDFERKAGLSQQERDELSTQIISMLRIALEKLAAEIKRSLSYYSAQPQGIPVNKILLAGDAVRIQHLDKFLSKELSLNTGKIWLPDTISVEGSVNQGELLHNLAGIGAALTQGKGVNLLPLEFRTERIEKLERFSLRWVGLIAFLLLALAYLFASVGINAYQKRLKNATLQLNILTEVKQVKELTDEYNKFISGVKESEPELGLLLKKLSSLASADIFLDNLDLDSESKSGFLTGIIKEQQQDKETALTQFAKNLGESGYFTNISIASVDKAKSNGQEAISFKINFNLP